MEMDTSVGHHYGNLPFEELRRLLQQEELRIEHAVKNKEWKLAAKLEASL